MAKEPTGERIGPFVAVFCAIFSVCGIVSLLVWVYPQTIPIEGKLEEFILQDLQRSIAKGRSFFYVFLEDKGMLSEDGLGAMLDEAKKGTIIFRVILLSTSTAQQEIANNLAKMSDVLRVVDLLPYARGSFWTTGASCCMIGRHGGLVIRYPYAPRRVLRYNKEFEECWQQKGV